MSRCAGCVLGGVTMVLVSRHGDDFAGRQMRRVHIVAINLPMWSFQVFTTDLVVRGGLAAFLPWSSHSSF